MAQAVDPDREDPGKTELTVAPDITVALPPPGSGSAEQRIRATPRRDDLLDNLRGTRRDGRQRPAYDRERDAQQEIERLKAELARTMHDRDQAARERDRTVREHDQAIRERDGMASERDQALRERDRAIARAEKLAHDAETRHDRRAGPGHATVPRSRSAPGRAVVWAQRVLAISVLVIVVLALAITTRVL